MQGNDLANRVVPRFVLVWEGLLGLIPDVKVAAQEEKFRSKKKWDKALACYEINEMLARKVWDQVWRYSIEVDLLTYLGNDFAEVLTERMTRENIPVRHVFHETPEAMARSLAYRLEIAKIYDPYPEHRFLYGGKGFHLSPDQFNAFGVT